MNLKSSDHVLEGVRYRLTSRKREVQWCALNHLAIKGWSWIFNPSQSLAKRMLLTPTLAGFVTLSKLLNLSEPCFFHP